MEVGVKNHWRLNGIKIPFDESKNKVVYELRKPPIQSCYTVVIFATRPEPAKKQG